MLWTSLQCRYFEELCVEFVCLANSACSEFHSVHLLKDLPILPLAKKKERSELRGELKKRQSKYEKEYAEKLAEAD